MRLVFGEDAAVAAWVSARIPQMAVHGAGFGPCVAIGVADDAGKPVAGVVYHSAFPEYATMGASVAADDPRWATRGVLRAVLHYPFEQAGVYKLRSIIALENERSIKFNLGLGFVKEGVLAHEFGPGKHAVVTRLTLPGYRKLMKRLGGTRQPDRIAA